MCVPFSELPFKKSTMELIVVNGNNFFLTTKIPPDEKSSLDAKGTLHTRARYTAHQGCGSGSIESRSYPTPDLTKVTFL